MTAIAQSICGGISILYSLSISAPKTGRSLLLHLMARFDCGPENHRCLRDCFLTQYPYLPYTMSLAPKTLKYLLQETMGKSIRRRCPKGLVSPAPLP